MNQLHFAMLLEDLVVHLKDILKSWENQMILSQNQLEHLFVMSQMVYLSHFLSMPQPRFVPTTTPAGRLAVVVFDHQAFTVFPTI
jgi:hypothetical protein